MKNVYLLIILILIQLITICFAVHVNMNYIRLKSTYKSLMKGKDGRTLERSILENTSRIEELEILSEKNVTDIKKLSERSVRSFQKTAIVKYDAFGEDKGALSFALTVLDENNNGWILNFVQGSFRNYNYIKEIVNGESYIELSNEEKESLEKAIDHELCDIKDKPEVDEVEDILKNLDEINNLDKTADIKGLDNSEDIDDVDDLADFDIIEDLDGLDISDLADIINNTENDTNDEEDI